MNLVRKKDIREDLESIQSDDFLVNRLTPYCETKDACRDIWSVFPKFTEGEDWDSAWPSVTGRIIDDSFDSVAKVNLSIDNQKITSFIPKLYRGSPIEDYGFITYL